MCITGNRFTLRSFRIVHLKCYISVAGDFIQKYDQLQTERITNMNNMRPGAQIVAPATIWENTVFEES